MDTPEDTPLRPLRVEYAITRDEFVRANLHPFRAQRLRGILLYFLLAALFVFLAWIDPEHGRWSLLLLAAFFGVRAAIMPFTMRDMLRKYYREHAAFAEETVTTLSDQGMTNESPTGVAVTRWHAFTHYAETPELFLLYRGPKHVHYLPKRAFESPEQLELCRRYLVDYVGRTAIENRPGFPVARPAVPVTPVTPPES